MTDAPNTDYVVTSTQRTDAGHVTYHATDRYGQRYHVAVRFARSTPEQIDPIIRHVIATHRPKRRTP
jgi:hypothetical protein